MYKSKKPYHYGTGRRKSSVARVHLFPNGTGSITINGGTVTITGGLGAEGDGNRIVVGPDMMTSIPGLYAAGDCTGGLLQVAKAVYEGAMAGSEAAKALRKGGFYGG